MTVAKNTVEVEGLKTWFGTGPEPVKAVDGVSFSIPEKSTVALVGESGCGKSVTAMSLTRLLPSPPARYAGGRVLVGGRDTMQMTPSQLSGIRGREIAYIFQEPGTALNPVFRVGYQIGEAVRLSGRKVRVRDEVLRLMHLVGLPEPERRIDSYPHELSGGMQQRVMIAMALASQPRLLVADEPTTALDVTIQAQILELLGALQKELGMSVLLITHNLGLVAETAHTVHVMYGGRLVESGGTEEVLRKPAHPYTRGLLDAVPRLSVTKTMRGIDGTVPNPAHLPVGCKFAPRCPRVKDKCRGTEPEMTMSTGDRQVRCYFPLS